jgi:starch synthase (maltosyl-transferring)
MKLPEKMLIYNIFPPLAGPFTLWRPHLERAARMNFNWIFVNPVQHPGFSGSLYSISDYYALNPLFLDAASPLSPDEQLKSAISLSQELGMKVMVDLVVNHCSVDSPLIKEHPGWFEWKGGKVVNPFAWENGKKVVWGDLARFDHEKSKDREGLYEFFHDVVENLIGLGFRGFRCDAAYQVPGRFWKKLIRDFHSKHKGIIFMAETLGCTPEQTRKTASSGFDYIFNSSKWWDMKKPWLMEQYNLTRETAPSISFPETHDTLRLAKENDGNIAHLKQRYLFSAFFSAGVMIPMGYEFGFRKRLHVVRTRPTDWEKTDIDISDFIAAVNGTKSSCPVFQEDCPTSILQADNHNVLFIWKGSCRTNEEALLIINKDVQNKQHFHADDLYAFIQSRAPLVDLSPEFRLDYIPTPFEYELRPGQGIVLVSRP